MNAIAPYTEQEHPPSRYSPASAFALVVGVLLLVEGLWGLASPVVFGVLTTNLPHAIIHTVLGLYGIAVGLGRDPAGYLLFLGALLLAVGLLYFVPMATAMLTTLLNVNTAVALVNIVAGSLALVLRGFDRGW
ncbi:MAG: hypothetical protein JWP29_5031 [Rhodoferax sp.]|nr:hypothetical protein [Rhodoferax sp.]